MSLLVLDSLDTKNVPFKQQMACHHLWLWDSEVILPGMIKQMTNNALSSDCLSVKLLYSVTGFAKEQSG